MKPATGGKSRNRMVKGGRTSGGAPFGVTLSVIMALGASSAQAQVATQAPGLATQSRVVAPPAALEVDGPTPVPLALADETRPYLESRAAILFDWHPESGAMLIATRFGNTNQLHSVDRPGGARTQISFESDPIAWAGWAPGTGDVLLVQKDQGGDEFFQLYRLKAGRLTLLTDGKSRNSFNAWSRDGRWIGYSSTRRNGTDSDLYVMDPRDPKTDRLVAQVNGGGWSIADFAPDGRRALVAQYVSVTHTRLFMLDLNTGAMTPVGDPDRAIAYGGARFAPDGSLWVTSDEGSDFKRLGLMDPASGTFTPRSPEPRWDVEEFVIAPDGRSLVYSVNENGITRVKRLQPGTTPAHDRVAQVNLPVGNGSRLTMGHQGQVGLTLSSARSAADAWGLDGQTLAATQWTQSETGGLDPSRNAEPELITVKSFDGEPVSGFLYRPDARRFPGRRPLILVIHGGPEAQSGPGFLGRNNYYLNELGIALFLPNVRGSTGYGKRFVALDNGPFKRENSVKDIGAFLTRLKADPHLDATRFGVSGGSYGGYMCYAVTIRYGADLKGANCIVAISNFVTFLENTQSYRRDLRRVEYGDERDPKQRAKLMAISPLTQASAIRIPVFVVTGANDPRVPASEADQIVAAVRGRGGVAWHLIGRNEGHGFARKENADYQFWTSLIFWRQTLLGPQGVQ